MKQDRFLLKSIFVCICGLSIATVAKADYTANLLAQWTFNTGTSADLTSDIGSFTFAEIAFGSNPTTTYNSDGTISLGSGRELVATGINSTTYSGLKTGVTVWARMAYNATATTTPYTFGLMATATPTASFADMALTEEHNGSSGELTAGHVTDGTAFGAGSGFPATPAVGTFANYAIVFQQTDATHYNYQLNLNGTVLTRSSLSSPAASLEDFACLALGRLYGSAAVGLSFDEVRVYDTALTAAQISQIEVAPVPEPSSLAITAGGVLVLFAVRKWRKNEQ